MLYSEKNVGIDTSVLSTHLPKQEVRDCERSRTGDLSLHGHARSGPTCVTSSLPSSSPPSHDKEWHGTLLVHYSY